MDGPESALGEGATLASTGREVAAGSWFDVGVLVAHTPLSDPRRLRAFGAWMMGDAAEELGRATDVAWQFHAEEPALLPDADDRRPAEFLDEATHRMVEGRYDVVVLTDAPLRSSRDRSSRALPRNSVAWP